MSNTLGTLFKLTTFGESHGDLMGGVIDGFPANFHLDLHKVQEKINLRKPGRSNLVSSRKESDIIEFKSGILNFDFTINYLKFSVTLFSVFWIMSYNYNRTIIIISKFKKYIK